MGIISPKIRGKRESSNDEAKEEKYIIAPSTSKFKGHNRNTKEIYNHFSSMKKLHIIRIYFNFQEKSEKSNVVGRGALLGLLYILIRIFPQISK